MANDKPKLGDWVLFTHYYGRSTHSEIDQRAAELEESGAEADEDGVLGLIERPYRQNPTPLVPALVVGVRRLATMGVVGYNARDGEYWADFRTDFYPRRLTTRRVYALKTRLDRGRFFVDEADIQPKEVPPNDR